MHLASPSGDNQLNYSEAKALCGTKGARLATWGEMITAYMLGTVLPESFMLWNVYSFNIHVVDNFTEQKMYKKA